MVDFVAVVAADVLAVYYEYRTGGHEHVRNVKSVWSWSRTRPRALTE